MLLADLLRITVLLIAALASVLATVTVLVLSRDLDTATLILAAAWWPLAAAIGLVGGRRREAGERLRALLAGARTSSALPEGSPEGVLLRRVWPFGAVALVAGGLGWLWPQVPAIGTGYALLWALAWRRKESAVTAIEERDGVRFYVEPGSAVAPIRLTRTPGLGR